MFSGVSDGAVDRTVAPCGNFRRQFTARGKGVNPFAHAFHSEGWTPLYQGITIVDMMGMFGVLAAAAALSVARRRLIGSGFHNYRREALHWTLGPASSSKPCADGRSASSRASTLLRTGPRAIAFSCETAKGVSMHWISTRVACVGSSSSHNVFVGVD